MGKYINPFTDWGFKRLFGQEFSKDLLISFLNDLLVGELQVKNVVFKDKEELPSTRTNEALSMMYIVKPTRESDLFWRCRTGGSRIFSTAPSVMPAVVCLNRWTKARRRERTHIVFFPFIQSAL